MIQRRIAALVTLTISLTGCGSVSPADQALQRMHDVYLKQGTENIKLLKQSDLSRATSTIAFSTKRDAKTVGVGEPDFGVVANAALSISSDVSSDVRNPRIPLADGTILIEGKVTTPAGTFTGEGGAGAPAETVTAEILVGGRSVDQNLLVNISGVSVVTPLMPQPFELPADMSGRWYGISFNDLDAKLSEIAKTKGEPAPPPVRELFARSFGNHVSPAALLKLGKSIHVWKGLELLPEENGLVRIRVESDKKKVQASVRAFTEYVKEVSGQDWDEQLARNPEMKEKMDALLSDDAEFMKTMGTVKGVLSADATTYEFMGFDGDVLDASGTVKAHITFTRTQEGDFSGVLTDAETKETISLSKDGDKVIGLLNEKEFVKGTASAKAVDLTVSDPEQKKGVATIAFNIDEMTRESLKITKGTVIIPSAKLTIRLSELAVKITPPDGLTTRLEVSADIGTAQHLSLNMSMKREAIKELKLEKPEFKPIDSLYQDLLQAVIGSAETGGLPEAE